MKLGNYAEISTTVEDSDQAMAFYQQLGFQHVGYTVMTDGSINLNLAPAGVPAPMIRYAGSDIEAAAALDIGFQKSERGVGVFHTPEGVHVMLSPFESRIPMPEGTPLTRTPLSRCGKFGEFALPVADKQAAIVYWEQLGFTTLYTTEEPYPFAILSDELLVIGLHQTAGFSEPHLTYFAPDMAARIAALQAEGIEMTPVSPDGSGVMMNASFSGPGGEKIFLFQGEV